MRFHRTLAVLLLALTSVGCTTLQDTVARGQNDEGGAWRWTSEWYEQEACSPTGARQLDTHGRLWPPFPRPTGPGQQWTHRFHNAHYWPHPYNCQDRGYLRSVSASQVANGWVQETTMYEHHFDERDNTLNAAGALHLQWIVQTAPEERRFVWVQSTGDGAINDARLRDVRLATAELANGGAPPTVSLRITPSIGRPTREINAIRTSEAATRRPPRIEYAAPTGGSASGT